MEKIDLSDITYVYSLNHTESEFEQDPKLVESYAYDYFQILRASKSYATNDEFKELADKVGDSESLTDLKDALLELSNFCKNSDSCEIELDY
jgi:hypothetical protein